jgi:serine/threonine protein phosphatase 1
VTATVSDLMTKRTIAIGDIHGCSVALRTLLPAINPQSDDTLVLLGDYIDRGPDSRGVLDQLIELVERCEVVPLLGNHELMLLQSLSNREMFEFWRACGGNETLQSYGGSLDNMPFEHLVFLRGLRRYHETEKFIFVHANYDEALPIDQASDDLLFWEHVKWVPPSPHFSGKTVIVGHTPPGDGHVLDLGHLICLDTYCFGGEWLTAMDVDTREILQANQEGQLRHA